MTAIKALVAALILALTLVACDEQSDPTATPVNIDMSMQVEPEPLAVGEATLIITLKDDDGSPIDGATLQVHGDMDHEGMIPVDREISESSNGDYQVPFEWTMGGGWIVTVTAQLPDDGGEISEDFEFFVEAIPANSIINRDNQAEETPEAEMDHDHDGMDMDTEETPEASMDHDHDDMDMDAEETPEASMDHDHDGMDMDAEATPEASMGS